MNSNTHFNKQLILKEFSKLIIGSLGMISALSWNEAFTNFFKLHPMMRKRGPWIYAIIITIITLLITAIIVNYNLINQSDDIPVITNNSSTEENKNTNN